MGLWVLRHAKPLIGQGVCYGQLDMPADPDLTLGAARAAAKALPANARLRYSPLQRCEQLTQALCSLRPDLALDCRPDARLMEMHFGVHESQRWADIDPGLVQAWTDDFADHRFGGAESVREFMARVGGVWDEREVEEVWVSHAGVARAASLLHRGLRCVGQACEWPVDAPAYGEWLQLEAPYSGAGVLAR
ncbi:histidine phosphatase family protein [Rhodoferax sp. OV413]|uniref:histidine phosphatase family protein n=1 Tax=Rhodoferax sp. OV413 TaxID=1855285 RepID=UPI0025DC8D53|nr:histidine phosphatase family protein [Rhodoferax sp. OV413]